MAYKKGAGGLRATASAHDVGVDSLRAWIAAYEANGKAGLVAKRRVIYDLEFKLEVLRRMQDEGLSCRRITVQVTWPMTGAASCAAWVREVLQ